MAVAELESEHSYGASGTHPAGHANNFPTWIDLDWPFNYLLHDGGAPLEGIELPTCNSPGSGNVVICGRAGTGKSTLAMQLAVSAARNWPTHAQGVSSLYLALEESVQGVRSKARLFGWNDWVQELRHFGPRDAAVHADGLAQELRKIVGPSDDPPNNTLNYAKTWVSTLSPRPLMSPADRAALFKERFAQLERLVTSAQELNRYARANPEKRIPAVGLVCIDSLSMFGFPPDSRESAYRLFDLPTVYRWATLELVPLVLSDKHCRKTGTTATSTAILAEANSIPLRSDRFREHRTTGRPANVVCFRSASIEDVQRPGLRTHYPAARDAEVEALITSRPQGRGEERGEEGQDVEAASHAGI